MMTPLNKAIEDLLNSIENEREKLQKERKKPQYRTYKIISQLESSTQTDKEEKVAKRPKTLEASTTSNESEKRTTHVEEGQTNKTRFDPARALREFILKSQQKPNQAATKKAPSKR